jgi:IclR family pca regulon transcriptional regulator
MTADPVHDPDDVQDRDDRLFIDVIEKGFVILEAFNARNRSMNIAQLSGKTGLGRSATQRIVYTLHKLGYLQRDEETKRHSLSPKSLSLGSRYLATDNLVDMAQPFLREIADRFDETVTLARLDQIDIVIISRIASTQMISANVPVGSRFPVEGSASGWALTAFLPEPLQADMLRRIRLARTAPAFVALSEQLVQEVGGIRRRGFSAMQGPLFAGGISLAAPVLNVDGQAIAAIALSCPAARWSVKRAKDQLAPVLVSAAHAMSRQNGWEESI